MTTKRKNKATGDGSRGMRNSSRPDAGVADRCHALALQVFVARFDSLLMLFLGTFWGTYWEIFRVFSLALASKSPLEK